MLLSILFIDFIAFGRFYMKISKKCEYAIKAVIELAVNYDKGAPGTLINEVVKRTTDPIEKKRNIPSYAI